MREEGYHIIPIKAEHQLVRTYPFVHSHWGPPSPTPLCISSLYCPLSASQLVVRMYGKDLLLCVPQSDSGVAAAAVWMQCAQPGEQPHHFSKR